MPSPRTRSQRRPSPERGPNALLLVVALLAAGAAAAAQMWFPVVNDEFAIVSLNQESLVARGRIVSAELQYVLIKTSTLPYADDERADTFKRMKTWLEFDCDARTTKVLERTLIGERGNTVAEGVPASLRGKAVPVEAGSRDERIWQVACGGLYGR